MLICLCYFLTTIFLQKQRKGLTSGHQQPDIKCFLLPTDICNIRKVRFALTAFRSKVFVHMERENPENCFV